MSKFKVNDAVKLTDDTYKRCNYTKDGYMGYIINKNYGYGAEYKVGSFPVQDDSYWGKNYDFNEDQLKHIKITLNFDDKDFNVGDAIMVINVPPELRGDYIRKGFLGYIILVNDVIRISNVKPSVFSLGYHNAYELSRENLVKITVEDEDV